MKELLWLILIFVAIWGGYYLLRWAFPRLARYFLKRLIRNSLGIDVEEPKRRREPRRPSKPYFSSGPRPKRRRRGKKIPHDVGEYVEFEEINSSYEYHASDGSRFKVEEQVVDVKWKDIK